jgi:hypothetical protein
MPDLRYQINVEGGQEATGEIARVAEAVSKAHGSEVNFLGSIGEAARAQAAAAEGATKKLQEAGRAAHEANMVFSGLERGGVGGATEAFRGLIGLLRGPFAATMGTVGAVIGPVFALWGLGMAEMSRRTKESEREMAEMWTDARERADRYKKAIEQIGEAAKKMTADMLADVQAINAGMAYMEKARAGAQAHAQAVGSAKKDRSMAELDLSKEQELAKAKSPEERAAIEAKYGEKRNQIENEASANDLLNEKLGAQNSLRLYTSKQFEATESIRSADVQAGQAKSEFEDLTARAGESLAHDGTTKGTLDLQEKAREAKAKYEKLVEAADKVRAEAGKIVDHCEDEIDKAKTSLETIPIRAQTLTAKEHLQTMGGSRSSPQISGLRSQGSSLDSQIAGIQSQLEISQAAGDKIGSAYSPERSENESRLTEQLNQLVMQRQQTTNALGDYLMRSSGQERDTQKKLKEQDDSIRDLGLGG